MRAGQARSLVVERNTPVSDGQGGFTDSWATLFHAWAEVTPQTGTEVFRSDKQTAIKSARFVFRWDTRIALTDRLYYEEEYYHITYIREMGRREGVEVLAEVRA